MPQPNRKNIYKHDIFMSDHINVRRCDQSRNLLQKKEGTLKRREFECITEIETLKSEVIMLS